MSYETFKGIRVYAISNGKNKLYFVSYGCITSNSTPKEEARELIAIGTYETCMKTVVEGIVASIPSGYIKGVSVLKLAAKLKEGFNNPYLSSEKECTIKFKPNHKEDWERSLKGSWDKIAEEINTTFGVDINKEEYTLDLINNPKVLTRMLEFIYRYKLINDCSFYPYGCEREEDTVPSLTSGKKSKLLTLIDNESFFKVQDDCFIKKDENIAFLGVDWKVLQNFINSYPICNFDNFSTDWLKFKRILNSKKTDFNEMYLDWEEDVYPELKGKPYKKVSRYSNYIFKLKSLKGVPFVKDLSSTWQYYHAIKKKIKKGTRIKTKRPIKYDGKEFFNFEKTSLHRKRNIWLNLDDNNEFVQITGFGEVMIVE